MVKGKLLIIVLYIDDLILTGDDQLIVSCKENLTREFEMTDMGLMHYFLGMEVWQKDGELFVSQGKYANEILKRFHLEKCKPMQTPLAGNWRKEDATSGEVVESTVYRRLVGSLMYLVSTRPNLCYAMNQLSQAMVQPTKMFWKVKNHVLRYLRGTSQYGLWYRQTEGVKLQGFTDAEWKILAGLVDLRMDPTVIYCDYHSCIKLSKNPVFHDRSKHIDIRYHHLRDYVARRIMLLQYISTKEKDADILTKALLKCKFEFHRDRIRVADNPFLVEREC
eukprot:PITA_15649